jgi:hypothetical protein
MATDKEQMTNNDLRNTTKKAKEWRIRIPQNWMWTKVTQ